MKMRLLKLKPNFLMRLLQGKEQSISSNLPNETELIDIKYDLLSGIVLIIIRNDNFEDIAECYPIPEFNLKYTQPTEKDTKIVRPKPKIKLVKQSGNRRNQDISAYQREFSPEQRELLSFKIEGDYLVVKPVKYLKKEWNEINEVVKNIGGEWIKGSIISYWKIPI